MLKTVKYALGAAVIFALAPSVSAQMHLRVDNASYELASKAMQKGNYTTAAQLFRKAIKGNLRGERLVSAYNNLCAISFAEGAFEQAEKACDEAILADRASWRAYANRSVVRKARGKHALAQADRNRAQEIAPEKVLEGTVVASIVHHKW